MKRSPVLYAASVAAFVSMNCSQAGPATGPGAAGAPAAQAGAAGLAGAPALAGAGPVGTAGAPISSSAGAGGSVGGASGAPALGGAAGAVVAGSGGAPSGGAAGGPAGGSAGAGITPADIVPDLDGFIWEGTCSGTGSATGKNCPFADDTATSCPSQGTWAQKGATKKKTLMVKGVTGTKYTIHFEARGVVGTRCYTGGMPGMAFGTPSATGPNNTWYIGGTQYNDSIWNTYEINVKPPVTGEKNVYFANAFPMSPDWCQKEGSYEVGFKASFAVMGGGTIDFVIHDANCQAQQNCGSNDMAATCDSPRTISLAGLSPAGTFTQPRTNTIGSKIYYPQWLYFDVQSVTSP